MNIISKNKITQFQDHELDEKYEIFDVTYENDLNGFTYHLICNGYPVITESASVVDFLVGLCHVFNTINNNNSYNISIAEDNAIWNFKQGIHQVYTHEDSTIYLPDEIIEKEKFCNIHHFADDGDPSVGIMESSGWCLSDDQSGTGLQILMKNNEKFNKIKEILNTEFLLEVNEKSLIDRIIEIIEG